MDYFHRVSYEEGMRLEGAGSKTAVIDARNLKGERSVFFPVWPAYRRQKTTLSSSLLVQKKKKMLAGYKPVKLEKIQILIIDLPA